MDQLVSRSTGGMLRLTLAVLVPAVLLLGLACSGGDGTPTPTPGTTSTPAGTPIATASAEWVPDGLISAGEYAGSEIHGNYEVYWKGDGQYVYVGMRARTGGFVAVGFQPGNRMKGADIVLGFVESGQVSVFDMYSTGDFGPHPSDTDLGGTYDVAESGGREEGGSTTIEFKRALVTGDDRDNPLSPGSNRIIWSYGSSDSPTLQHAARGYGELTL